MERVKIVATIGPASSDKETIARMIAAGLDVVRLNFSHGSHDDHRQTYETVRAEAKRADAQVAVLADLCGPKMRVGRVRDGAVTLEPGAEVVITTEQLLGDATRFSTSYAELPHDVDRGARILLDDGMLELEVREVRDKDVVCKVVTGGVLKDRKGINIPGTPLSTPALTEKDRDDLAFARELGVDYFALSFVRSPDDVLEAKRLAGDVPVIAKIEKPEAVDRTDEIVEVADGLMVARGDLGVEAGAEKVPLIQKRLIRAAATRGRPVIVATQMLESMMDHPQPTRAEVSDVANAVLDGTDAVMLSGETAVGKYPVEAVAEMSAIISEVESSELFEQLPNPVRIGEYSFSNAIARAAVTAAEDLKLDALVVYTETGHSASLVSACRPMAWIVAFSRHDQVLRRLTLRWGVVPLKAERWTDDVDGVVEQAEQALLAHGLVKPGDDIGITFGMQKV
ncbi:MAG: pyruvate kinase, partial [Deltaproteobacteria bacterium]|nr:pyruvate kinase [Deltaproteobacteria bacterium]